MGQGGRDVADGFPGNGSGGASGIEYGRYLNALVDRAVFTAALVSISTSTVEDVKGTATMVRVTILIGDNFDPVGEFEFDQLARNGDSVTIPWPADDEGCRIFDVDGRDTHRRWCAERLGTGA